MRKCVPSGLKWGIDIMLLQILQYSWFFQRFSFQIHLRIKWNGLISDLPSKMIWRFLFLVLVFFGFGFFVFWLVNPSLSTKMALQHVLPTHWHRHWRTKGHTYIVATFFRCVDPSLDRFSGLRSVTDTSAAVRTSKEKFKNILWTFCCSFLFICSLKDGSTWIIGSTDRRITVWTE